MVMTFLQPEQAPRFPANWSLTTRALPQLGQENLIAMHDSPGAEFRWGTIPGHYDRVEKRRQGRWTACQLDKPQRHRDTEEAQRSNPQSRAVWTFSVFPPCLCASVVCLYRGLTPLLLAQHTKVYIRSVMSDPIHLHVHSWY